MYLRPVCKLCIVLSSGMPEDKQEYNVVIICCDAQSIYVYLIIFLTFSTMIKYFN